MSLQFVFSSKRLATDGADEGPLPRVDDGVSREFVLPGVGVAAHAALVGPFSCVDTHVHR